MGFLKLFSKPAATLLRLPSGSFTVDREGNLLIGTLPSSFPAALARDIGRQVVDVFREAASTHLPLSEIVVHYPSLRIRAREMRGGAMVFLSPKNLTSSSPTANP
jgi:hypothetical protein